MPFYLAWIFSNFSRWNFKFFSISDLSYGTNQDFMPFIHAQFFVARYPQKLHSEVQCKDSTYDAFIISECKQKICNWLVSVSLSLIEDLEINLDHDSNIKYIHGHFQSSEYIKTAFFNSPFLLSPFGWCSENLPTKWKTGLGIFLLCRNSESWNMSNTSTCSA